MVERAGVVVDGGCLQGRVACFVRVCFLQVVPMQQRSSQVFGGFLPERYDICLAG